MLGRCLGVPVVSHHHGWRFRCQAKEDHVASWFLVLGRSIRFLQLILSQLEDLLHIIIQLNIGIPPSFAVGKHLPPKPIDIGDQ